MTARILDGRPLAEALRADVAARASDYHAQHGRPAHLVVVQVGDNAAAQVYTRALVRTAAQVGVGLTPLELAAETTEAEFRACILALNEDAAVQGILPQLPLPAHLPPRLLAETLDPRKDVDGISLRSAGNLFLRQPSFIPSTCAGVLELLDRSAIPLAGTRVVVVGASNVVGKPLAFLLLHRDATVTVCHIYTRDLAAWTRQAEVLVVAAGKPGLITGEMVRPGATVVDVGITLGEDGRIQGDVDAASVERVAGALSPVPGGVGALTRLMLLRQMLTPPDL